MMLLLILIDCSSFTYFILNKTLWNFH